MGKRITLYLTDAELKMITDICAKDGVGPNMSKTLKMGLLKMFEGCFVAVGHKGHGDFLVSSGELESTPADVKLKLVQEWLAEMTPEERARTLGIPEKRMVPNKPKPFITIVEETEEKKKEKDRIKHQVDEELRKEGIID